MVRRKIFRILVVVAFSLSALYAVKLVGGTVGRQDENRIEALKIAPAEVSSNDGGTSEYALTVRRSSQQLSGISARLLSSVRESRSVKVYGAVLDLRNLTSLVTEYEAAKATARKSIFQLEISRNKYARAKLLFKSTKYVSIEQLQDAKAAYYSDLADSESAFDNLSGLKGRLTEEWGHRISAWVTSGSSFVRKLMSNEMAIVLVTMQEGVNSNKAPRTALVKGTNGNMIQASLISMSPVSNPEIQGVSYFYEAPVSPSLPTGANIVAYLDGGKKMSGVSIPSSAVVWYNGVAWIFLKSGATRFTRKEIALTIPTTDGWFVDHGLNPGDEVVVKGAQILLSQQLKGSALGRDD